MYFEVRHTMPSILHYIFSFFHPSELFTCFNQMKECRSIDAGTVLAIEQFFLFFVWICLRSTFLWAVRCNQTFYYFWCSASRVNGSITSRIPPTSPIKTIQYWASFSTYAGIVSLVCSDFSKYMEVLRRRLSHC